MKSLKYILHSSLMLLAVSCMQEVLPEPESGSEEVAGDKVTITFGVDFASREYDGWGEGELATKAFGEMTNAKRNGLKLRIYVFDHYGMFTEYADAEIVDPQPTTIAPNDCPQRFAGDRQRRDRILRGTLQV